MTIRFFAVGQEATGVIAVGQLSTGVIAIGQGATGFIAIGQMARGVFAVGMLSVGLVSVGMLSFGLIYSIGMIGAGGAGKGGILPLVPILPKRPLLPSGPGWLVGAIERATAADQAAGYRAAAAQFFLRAGAQRWPLELPPALVEGATTAADGKIDVAALTSERPGGVLAVSRLVRAGKAERITPPWLGLAAAQLLGLAIGSYLYFQYVLVELVDTLIILYRALA